MRSIPKKGNEPIHAHHNIIHAIQGIEITSKFMNYIFIYTYAKGNYSASEKKEFHFTHPREYSIKKNKPKTDNKKFSLICGN